VDYKNHENEIHVGMAAWEVTQAPALLISLGLGSCVAITLYDQYAKIGGLAHIMLPDIETARNKSNRAKFANTAIPDMLKRMEDLGAKRKLIKAKIMGGAHMFGFTKLYMVFDVGKRNIEKVTEVLEELHIKIIAEDIGGTYGRSIFFDLDTGQIRVRSVDHGEKFL